jgi:hypothetical protein
MRPGSRYSPIAPQVVRAGGKPKARTSVFPSAGSAFLWQARIEQIAEHATEFVESQLALPRPEGQTEEQWRAQIVARLPGQFRYLPPAGLLPKEIIAPRAHTQSFFPASFAVDAVPIPVEQLDLALEQSAALAIYDTFAADSAECWSRCRATGTSRACSKSKRWQANSSPGSTN